MSDLASIREIYRVIQAYILNISSYGTWQTNVPLIIEYGILLGLIITILSILAGFIYPNYSGILTFGITPQTATGTPLLDASRVLGFFATIIGMIIGYLYHRMRVM